MLLVKLLPPYPGATGTLEEEETGAAGEELETEEDEEAPEP